MGTASTANTLDTDNLIKSVLKDDQRASSRKSLPELAPVEYDANPAPRSDEASGNQHLKAKQSSAKPMTPKGQNLGLKQRMLTYRPTRKHLVIAAFVFVMVVRPWLIPGILFVSFWVGLIVWLTLGPDRIIEWISNGWDRLSVRNPALAERLRQRGDAFALRFDALLDKLPDRWAEKLALPDMSKPIEAERDLSEEPDPFQKLKLPEVYRG